VAETGEAVNLQIACEVSEVVVCTGFAPLHDAKAGLFPASPVCVCVCVCVCVRVCGALQGFLP
jgi:hypothetical protein